jgi:hypothetical protein
MPQTAGNDVKAAFERWKAMLGDVERNLQEHALSHLQKADPGEDNVHVRLAVDYVRQQIAAIRAVRKQMGQPSDEPYHPLVQALGIVDDDLYLPVRYWAEFLRGPDGACAFCSGDDWMDPATPIGAYLQENDWATTCPVCQGRAT